MVTTVDALRDALVLQLALTDWRAVIVVVEAPAALDEALAAARADALAEVGVELGQVEWVAVDEGEACRARLRALNHDRDAVLRRARLVWIGVRDAAGWRFARDQTPDLTAAVDLFARIESPTVGDWAACRAGIAALMAQRHAFFDFTGLLPEGSSRLPLRDLYLDLVDWQPHERRGWLLMGDAGAGKTTALRHLALTYATEAGDPLGVGGGVPLLVSLGEFAQNMQAQRAQELVDFLPDWLAANGVLGGHTLAGHLDEVVMLLDGLDELPDGWTRRAMIAAANALLGRCRAVVVTGRESDLHEVGAWQARWHRVRCRVPTPAEVAGFVQRFVALRGGDPVRAARVVARIEANADLQALVRSPLLLTSLLTLEVTTGRMPDREDEIHERFDELVRTMSALTPRR